VIRGDCVESALADWLQGPALILGVGNPLRGDDAVGPEVCARMESPNAVDCGDAPERYLGLAADAAVGRVLIVDAMDFGGEAGEIAFCRAEDLVERFGTTHDSGLAVLSRYVEAEHGKPVAVLGIQPCDTRFGADVSAAALAAIEKVSAWLRRITSQWKRGEMEAAWSRS